MSGEKLLPRSRKPIPGSLEDRFSVEDDKRLFRFTGAGSVFGVCFAAWALTTVPYIPIVLVCPLCHDGDLHPPPVDTVPFYFKPPADYHRKIPNGKIAKRQDKPGRTGVQAATPKTAKPAEKPGWLGQNLITSRGDRLDVNAYDLIPKAMRGLDMDKLGEMPVLKRTPHSGIGGRRGKISHEFNLEYRDAGDGGSGGIEEMIIGSRPEAISSQLKRPTGSPKISEIEIKQDGNARSTADILAVIRARSPGLRHIYNGFLKQNPGFAGKVTLRFEIAPGGDVVAVDIVASTTHVRDFDAEILRQVKSWHFDPVKAVGNDNVTVPITFSE